MITTYAVLGLFGWSPWSTAVLLTIIVFFILAMANRWLGLMVPFNQFGAYAVGIPLCLFLSRYWSAKVGLVIGLFLGIGAGIGSAFFLGGTDSE